MRYVVLLSGGIDSIVCAESVRRTQQLVGCVFVDYGHPAQIPEGWKAFAYCGERGVPLKVVHAFGLNLGDMASEAGARVVPHRNAALLALSANAGESMAQPGETWGLMIGCNAADQRDYPDCRMEFLLKMEAALGHPIATPLLHMSKAQVIGEARRLNLARENAWSCYTKGPTECGKCPSCREAWAAWSAS